MCTIDIEQIERFKLQETKIVFLIDFENISKTSFRKVCGLTPEYALNYVFYSSNTPDPNWILTHTPCNIQLKLVECYTGENAMDFQLIASAGESCALNPDAVHVVVSNDKGYEPAIRMFQNKGRRIFQYRPNANADKIPPEPEPDGKDIQLKEIIVRHCNANNLGQYAEEIFQIAKSTKDLVQIHNAIQQRRTDNAPKRKNPAYMAIANEIKQLRLFE